MQSVKVLGIGIVMVLVMGVAVALVSAGTSAIAEDKEPETNKLLPLFYSQEDLKDMWDFPARKVVHTTSDRRSWPMPKGW